MSIRQILSFCLALLYLSLTPPASASTPFATCPTEAFIIQTPASTPITFGVDLSIGSYSILSADMGTTKVNGAGFNYHDSYLYGWDYGAGTLSRFDSDYTPQPLTITSGKIGNSFYVGDVSVDENKWFGYRPGYGLYMVDLTDPDNAMTMVQIASAGTMGNPTLTDFAFHPTDGLIYAVDNNGFLLTIDPSTGAKTVIREVLNEASAGFRFVFGAQFFDVNNNLYISNNGNGYVYKIDVSVAQPEALFFAYGPTSSSNDGARCALAPVISSTGLDFGDAPDTYQTSFASSGPRHGETTLFLGALIDTEADAYTFPLSDDASDASDDDDGISFVTGIEIGTSPVISAVASQSGGTLNGWIDWNQDGDFDENEQIITDESLAVGANTVSYTVPIWAKAGDTWARFRLSTTAYIGPTVGVADGEVEDYQVTVTGGNVTVIYYPSSEDYTTIAYEDLWPIEGDYDMNDLLVNMRIAEYSIGDQIIRVEIEGQIAAIGAGFNNGFAIQFPSVVPSEVQQANMELVINGASIADPTLDGSQTYAVATIVDNVWSMATRGEGTCEYFRTETNCGSGLRPSWKLVMPLANGIAQSSFPEPPYDPFIFATPGTTHSSMVDSTVGAYPGKQWEVHLKNNAPTDALYNGLVAIGDDTSVPASQQYYQTDTGMPWAIEVPSDWKHPLEREDIRDAYPQFQVFAGSSGSEQQDWYIDAKGQAAFIFAD
jgi:LruC domain-containing protein